MLRSQRPALLPLRSPGKVTSVTLVTGRPGEAGEAKASCNMHGTMTEHSLAL